MEKLKDIQLIITDLDGTLLDDQKCMGEHMEALLPLLSKQHIAFTFATGRNYHIVQDYVKQLHVQVPYITNNGANIFMKDQCIYEKRIPKEDLRRIYSILQARSIASIAYSNHCVYTLHESDVLETFLKRLKGFCEIQEYSNDIYQCSIFKIVLIEDHVSLMNTLMKEINEACIHSHCVRSEGNVYTITNIDATKGNAIAYLMQYLHISPQHTITFGDNYNDVSMFACVSHSVAMNNAQEEIKQQALYIADDNNHHGVSAFIIDHIIGS